MLAHEFQDTAERLAQGTTEGDWRSAMSRTYYAVFHFFREFFLVRGRGGEAHFNLYAGLNNCGYPTVQPVAAAVDDLRRARVRADYDLSATLDKALAARTVQDADDVTDAFQNLLPTLSADHIVEGVRIYLQSVGRLPKP